MNKMKKPKKYQVPQAIDISGGTAIGQVSPMGFCSPGGLPSTTTCADGGTPLDNPPADCAPVGNMPQWGRCLAGGNVAHGCVQGSAVQDT